MPSFLRISLSKCRTVCTSSALPSWISAHYQKHDRVLFSTHGRTGIITLNRPKLLNCICHIMSLQIFTQLKEWENNKDLFIIKGNNKAFSAGGNIQILYDCMENNEKEVMYRGYRAVTQLNGFLYYYKVPYVAIIHGIVMGGGNGVSIHAKYRVATETSLFAMPETRIGMFPDVGVSYFLSRMANSLGPFLGLTGFKLKGFDLYHTGIATHFCLSEFLPELELEILEDPSNIDNILQKFQSKSIQRLPNSKEPVFSLAKNLETISEHFSANTVEDIIAGLQKKGDEFSKKILNTLSVMSPIALKIAVKVFQTHREKKLDLYETLNQDYRIASRLLQENDFHEGTRAVLVAKDKKPKWKPEKLSDITNEKVEEFFKPINPKYELNLPDQVEKFPNLHNTKNLY